MNTLHPMIPRPIRTLCARPVGIWGGGVTGAAVADFFRKLGVETALYDERPGPGGEPPRDFCAAPAGLHRLVIASPGFRPDHPWVGAAAERGIEVMGDLDLAARFWKGRILAVTGTNGKSTLTLLLTEALRAAGEDALACGNIGNPLVNAAMAHTVRTWAVCEVSSFQSERLGAFRPEAVLWTNFDEDHLDWHGDLRAYFLAKNQLLEHRRSEYAPCWAGASVAAAARDFGVDMPEMAEVVTPETFPAEARLPRESPFTCPPQDENYALARAFWNYTGLDSAVLPRVAAALRQLPHRLELVGEHREVRFWNDSKATNFHAALAGLSRFDQPVHWIGGGRSKGGDLERFVARAAPRVEQAFLIGETGEALAAAFRRQGVRAQTWGSLAEATAAAWRDIRPPGDIVFSPGFASFDQFRGYGDRGDQFRAIVQHLIASSTPHLSLPSL